MFNIIKEKEKKLIVDNAHKRKKRPAVVRRTLIDEGIQLALEHGLSAVTVQAVADRAGVTKGGFLHHFPNKQSLIDTMFQELLASIGQEWDAIIAVDPEPYGAFTRAYLESIMTMDWEDSVDRRAALSILMLNDRSLRQLWADWFNTWLEKHQHSDGTLALTLVRLAIDGLWLSELSGISLPNREQLYEQLRTATYPVISITSGKHHE
ncbi:TetR/AcrR family transcriptional regulator [Pectobacterium carotovorum]|uniref:TetR/AcrR family transcriptional regulator n=1 Tax=Pectobacterium carotovorum TaxID=554 RepID=UPI003017ABED